MSDILLYIKPFFISLALSLIFTKSIIKLSSRYNLFLKKEGKIRNISRFGGVAIIISFLCGIFFSGDLNFDSLKWGVVAASIFILFFGVVDDLKDIGWKKQFLCQIFVVVIMIWAGFSIDYIANPFGGSEFRLDQYKVSIINPEYSGQLSIFGSLFILFWIIGFMNVINWLDGLDGLAGGVGIIGSLVLFFLSISGLVNQPPLGIISISAAGAILGFLIFNFYPAKIYMGTSGSMFLGFILAAMAIFSGGKIATALLVAGLPIMDAVWVIAQRIKAGKSPFKGDMRHLHYRLLEKKWSYKKVIFFIYSICLVFGLSAIVFQSWGKVLALIFLFFFITVIVFILEMGNKNSGNFDNKTFMR